MEHALSKKDFDSVMSSLEFAHLGGGEIAYIKELTSSQAEEMFPSLPDLPSGINFYSLHAADGTPIALTESRSAAVANAFENDLETVSLH